MKSLGNVESFNWKDTDSLQQETLEDRVFRFRKEQEFTKEKNRELHRKRMEELEQAKVTAEGIVPSALREIDNGIAESIRNGKTEFVYSVPISQHNKTSHDTICFLYITLISMLIAKDFYATLQFKPNYDGDVTRNLYVAW